MEQGQLFNNLKLSGWRQFRQIEIDFHDRLTILTGANGAGKSTILNLLKCHFPFEADEKFLATPVKSENKTSFFFGGWISTKWDELFKRTKPEAVNEIGSITYSDQSVCTLTLPTNASMLFALQRSLSVEILGVNISSHRVNPRYEEIKSIPISGILPFDAYKDYFSVQKSYSDQSNYIKDGMVRKANPVSAIKQAIIGFATFGIGNQHVAPIPELVGLYDDFQEVLKKVLPEEVGFERLEIRTPEVIVVSSSGEFPIDGASGGLMSIIQVSWLIFLQSVIYRSGRFMVLIDEPENHLHPSMQRSFLSNLVAAFPTARFVVATHSPFIISSVKDSYVYALRHHTADASALRPLEPRSVNSHKLDQVQKAGPANDILREVLGVPVTLPEWSANELETIADEFADGNFTRESLKRLKDRLEEAGLSEFYPSAVERIKQ